MGPPRSPFTQLDDAATGGQLDGSKRIRGDDGHADSYIHQINVANTEQDTSPIPHMGAEVALKANCDAPDSPSRRGERTAKLLQGAVDLHPDPALNVPASSMEQAAPAFGA